MGKLVNEGVGSLLFEHSSGIDVVPRGEYHECVETITLKLERRQVQKLKNRARTTGRSQAAVVRELIDRHLGEDAPSLHDQAKDLCGSIAGSSGTSTRKLIGYGRD